MVELSVESVYARLDNEVVVVAFEIGTPAP